MFLARSLICRTLGNQNRLSNLSAISCQRNLFTDEYLGIDSFRKKRNKVRLGINNEAAFRERVKTSFEQSGLRNIFSEDLEGLVDIAETPEDLNLLGTIIRSSLQEGSRPLHSFPKLLSWYFALCKCMNDVSAAKELWRDPEVQKSGVFDKFKMTRSRYFTLLYENECYEDIVQDVEANLAQCTLDDVTLAMASLFHLNTDESFKKATELASKEPMKREDSSTIKVKSGSRANYIYAYLAFKRGECGTAYDILSDRSVSRSNRLSTNLKLTILTEVDRVEDALLLIRTELLPSHEFRGIREPRSKRHVCFEVMQNLSKKIKSRFDPSSEEAREFTALCKALDDTAILCDETLEQLLFEKIEMSKRYKEHMETRKSSRMRRKDLEEQADDVEDSQDRRFPPRRDQDDHEQDFHDRRH